MLIQVSRVLHAVFINFCSERTDSRTRSFAAVAVFEFDFSESNDFRQPGFQFYGKCPLVLFRVEMLPIRLEDGTLGNISQTLKIIQFLLCKKERNEMRLLI